MKFISITKSINIRPDWATIGAKLKAGTPLDITGAVANSSAAVGILADDAEKSSAEVAVVTEGSIDLAEVTASYGELEDDCIAAIKGIAFIGSDGNPIVPSGGGLPDYSEASDGDVLSIEDGEPAWKSGGLLPDYSMEEPGPVLTLYGPAGSGVPPVPTWLPPQSGCGGEAAWNAMMKHMVFAGLEATSNRSTDVYVQCSDGILQNAWEASMDSETGDWSYSFGEWMTDPFHAVPNFEDYTATLEYNLGLILEDAFSASHDTYAMRCQEPIVVCRKFVLPED